MGQPAIRVEGLSKQYALAAGKVRHDTLRDEIMGGLNGLFGGRGRGSSQTGHWALRDVSFNINQGDVVGIVGRNGSGKSTLLKLLSRITEPTKGRAELRGRVGSLLEVGTGFDRELTGRENIYLNGAILGMKKREIDRKFDEIVAFSEVEKFIDTPVKHYSSGMYVRLAFGVAAHLEPEILILDEVLAVGDARFQARCLGKMSEVAGDGRTVVFVSHSMSAVSRFCPRCIWLDQGVLKDFGPTKGVVEKYLAAGSEDAGQITYAPANAPGSEYVRLRSVRVMNGNGDPSAAVAGHLPICIEMEYETLRETTGLRLGVTLIGGDGTVLLSSKDLDTMPEDLKRSAGRHISRCELPPNFLNFGQYFISVGADFPMVQSHFHVYRALSFRVEAIEGNRSHIPDNREGLLRMAFPWTMERLN